MTLSYDSVISDIVIPPPLFRYFSAFQTDGKEFQVVPERSWDGAILEIKWYSWLELLTFKIMTS